jgi:chemotaxis protein methyltransferase CheR
MGNLILGTAINDREFEGLRALLYREAGITLSEQKKPMVCGRLGKRLEKLGLSSYGAYLQRIDGGQDPAELQMAIDLLTTNETYFFREPKHFDWLRDRMKTAPPGRAFRVWSAACSSGEEPYTIAMVAADTLGERPWEVHASDISTRVLDTARAGLYPMERAEHIPKRHLERYCLRGTGQYQGSFLIAKALRQRVQFRQINLQRPLPDGQPFDVIFLRNVMIYFDAVTKKSLVERLAARLLPEGRLVIGHSESLNGITSALHAEVPTVYARTQAPVA